MHLYTRNHEAFHLQTHYFAENFFCDVALACWVVHSFGYEVKRPTLNHRYEQSTNLKYSRDNNKICSVLMEAAKKAQ